MDGGCDPVHTVASDVQGCPVEYLQSWLSSSLEGKNQSDKAFGPLYDRDMVPALLAVAS